MNTVVFAESKWISEIIETIAHGEVGIKFVIHEGQIVRTEKAILEKSQVVAEVKLQGGRK